MRRRMLGAQARPSSVFRKIGADAGEVPRQSLTDRVEARDD